MKLTPSLLLGALLAGGALHASAADQYLPDLVQKAPYKAAYAKMVALPEWISQGKGTATPLRKVKLDNDTVLVGNVCKPHDCKNNQLVVVFDAKGTQSWGLLATRQENDEAYEKHYLGAPNETVKKLLESTFERDNPDD
ncbi:lysozyme inhibitor [Pseudomonas sp. S75]|uniref:Ivy family c-type lysozyme inhibitor n=1 Tax=unclassified Pseudomonas TaxID=196821 RepID=UPI001903F2C9|nr:MULTISPECIES: Ivy family c-type lysozyme inhibitor [unclassified Pseudomonas]MBJ9978392.1 lysozyme inhibitor [Pseudomonas sp. S30]MBK0156347.1 lysozyme inhibitor [Pseudomonas sp. S75]